MSIKPTIHERCERCGQRAATLRGDVIVASHICPNAPPRPQNPPRRWRASQVTFIRGEWSAEELQADLDAANAEIGELRDERLKLHMAVRDVEQAIRPFREHKEFPNE